MKTIIITLTTILLASTIWSATINQPFTYTATGDDGMTGQAERIVLKMAQTSDSLVNNWDDCLIVADAVPWPPGVMNTLVIPLDVEMGIAYFFAAVIFDEVPNGSGLSNIISITYPDTLPPDPIIDLQFGAPQ